MTRRWPLHPTPGHGEALTSWLHRLAIPYGMHLDQLVRHDLIPPGAPVPGSLDLDAPSELITILAARTGVPVEQVRRMTIAGWVPWLLDSLQPEPVPGVAFDTYVRQDSVLVTSKEHPDREVTNWRAWLPLNSKNRPVSRVCPVCVESTTDGSLTFPLIMQLPITLTCPRHGCRLNAAFGPYAFFGWEHSKANDRPAPRQVVIQDIRTEQALRTGTVVLPRRTVHVGVWFRLLRTLIEELSIPLSKLRTRPRRSIELIWRKVGHPARAGIVGAARTYETLPWPQQEMYLEAAATAIHLVGTGEIEARGTLGHLLTPEPDRPAHDGLPPRDIWDEAREAAAEALTLAQHDPLAAEHMLAILTSLTRTEKTFRSIRSDLIDLDVPETFLPPTLAAMRSRRTSPGLSHNSPVAIWKLDRLGRDLRHLVNIVHDLTQRGIGLKVLTGEGAAIDTTTASGKLVFGIFAALAEFERELIRERTLAGLAAARARGRRGGRPYKMTAAKIRLAMASMGQPDTSVGDLCKELGVSRQTLYRHVSPTGELRDDGHRVLTQSQRKSDAPRKPSVTAS